MAFFIKDGKKRKGTKISVTLNMKASRKMVLFWQIDSSKWKEKEMRMERTEELVKLEVTVQEKSSEGKE